jgi:glutathione synthase/RimK-type ligase-like ATP-grasp enzyme
MMAAVAAPNLPFPFLFIEPDDTPIDPAPSLDLMGMVARVSGRAHPTGARDKILVLETCGGRDIQADELVAELARRGAPVHYFHTADFLRACRLSLRLGGNEPTRGILELPTGDLALDEVRSVWFRGPGLAPIEGADLEGDAVHFARRETDAALFGMFGLLHDAFWVNPPDAERAAEEKLRQLKVAESVGLRIPRTLVTNDPQAARDFFTACDGQVILKTFRRVVGRLEERPERLILTNRVLAENLEQIDRVRHTPCLFQEYVPKDVELRVTIVGRRVFSAEIHSQRSPVSRDDYRRYDFANTPYYPHTLPAPIEGALLKMQEIYGLNFAAIDMIRRPDGEHVFLELNANAQFLWIQDLTGLPIREELAELLLRGAMDGGSV